MREALARSLIDLAESGRLPDRFVRLGVRAVIRRRLQDEDSSNPGSDVVAERLTDAPVVVHADLANQQHYEVPAGFFEVMLGPRLKYSACLWEPGAGLASAEEAMLELTAERAGIGNDQRILDLGCGWGSFALWVASRFPSSEIVAVSNSATQGAYIRGRAERSGLTNIRAVTADIEALEARQEFDRIVSIEMLEHVRNHRKIFERASGWLAPDGAMFVHVFAHRRHAYLYEVDGPGDWMAERFFSGGVMPSRALLPIQAAPFFELTGQWTVSGLHYHQTLEAWLDRLDANRAEAERILAAAGASRVPREVQAWRMFLMACSELFALRGGTEWAVEHYLFRPRS